jgi:hypothetical protein
VTDTATRGAIPAPDAALDQITRAHAENRERPTTPGNHAPNGAPLFVVIDEAHDFDRFAAISPAHLARVGETLKRDRAVTATRRRP